MNTKDEYFYVRLKDGNEYDFDKQCNIVDYSNERLCIFKVTSNDKFITLAMIPYDEIKYIFQMPI